MCQKGSKTIFLVISIKDKKPKNVNVKAMQKHMSDNVLRAITSVAKIIKCMGKLGHSFASK